MKYFDLANKVSKLSEHPEHKMGCVVVRKNRVVALGVNKLKTHPKSTHPHKRIHAEMAAILNKDVAGCDIYIYRETKTGNKGISRPCSYCYGMLVEAGIHNVYYINRDGVYVVEATDGETGVIPVSSSGVA